MPMQPGTSCPNLNHRRSDAPVRHCPQCGGTVNASHPITVCSEDRHTAARRQQSTFCAYCGVRLIGSRERTDQNRVGGTTNRDDRKRY
jgi:rRNA maturation protein Nop10